MSHSGALTIDSPLPPGTLSAMTLPSTAITLFGAGGSLPAVAVASALACGSLVHADGFVGIWGTINANGQLNVPAGLGTCSAVAAGGFHTAAIRSNGSLAVWGGGTTSTTSSPNYGQSIVPAGLGGNVGVVGAAACAFEHVS